MWIMISGPYRHQTNDDKVWEQNLKQLNQSALKVFEKGHFPLIGVNLTLPIIQWNEGSDYDKLMMPISMELAKRCDAVLRLGGPSIGADQEVDWFKSRGLPVYYHLEEIERINEY